MVIMASYWLRGPFSALSQIPSSFPLLLPLIFWQSFEAAVIFDFDALFLSHCLIPWKRQKRLMFFYGCFSFLLESLHAVVLMLISSTQHGESSLWRWREPHAWGELIDVWKKLAPCEFFLHGFDLFLFLYLCPSLPTSCPPLPLPPPAFIYYYYFFGGIKTSQSTLKMQVSITILF